METLAKEITTNFLFIFWDIFIYYFIFKCFFSHVISFSATRQLLHIVRNKIRKES